MTDLELTIEKALRRDMVRRNITDAHGRLLDIRTAVFLYTTSGGLYTAVSPRTWEALSADGKLEMHEAGVQVAVGIDGEVTSILGSAPELEKPLLGRKVRTKHGDIAYVIDKVDVAGWTLKALSGDKKERFIPTEKTGTLVFI